MILFQMIQKEKCMTKQEVLITKVMIKDSGPTQMVVSTQEEIIQVFKEGKDLMRIHLINSEAKEELEGFKIFLQIFLISKEVEVRMILANRI